MSAATTLSSTSTGATPASVVMHFHWKGNSVRLEDPNEYSVVGVLKTWFTPTIQVESVLKTWFTPTIQVETKYQTWILYCREGRREESDSHYLELIGYDGRTRTFDWDNYEDLANYIVNKIPAPTTQLELERA